MGFIFANHEYNPKKIVILYGHKNTIWAIIKFLERCINKENISHIPVEKLTDKYAIKEIENKDINISPHISSQRLVDELDFNVSEFAGEYICRKQNK